MFLEKFSPFCRMVAGAVGGICVGILFGLLFSLLIAWVSQQFGIEKRDGPMAYDIASFLGMGFGAVVGAIMGGVINSRKQ